MITVTKGNSTVQVRDNNQLAAYLNNGWETAQEKPAKATPAPKVIKAEVKADSVEIENGPAEIAEAKPIAKPAVKRGRKSTKTE